MHLRILCSLMICCALVVVPSAVAQTPNSDCDIAGRTQLECGTTGMWFGSLPAAIFNYSASWALINNNTGAFIVGATGCAVVVPPAGSCQVNVNVGGAGTFGLQLTLTTSSGVNKICDITITVVDTTPPVITCPPDTNVECGTSTDPSVTGMPTAVDCSPVGFTHLDAVGASNCAGAAIVRTWTATDSSGNTDTCVQIITRVDTTAPQINCPPPVTVECDSQIPPPNPGSVTATDLCAGVLVPIFVNDVPVGSCPKTITRTYSATDPCGNTSSCTQTITVDDITPPTITCPPDVAVSDNGMGCQVLNIGIATAVDNCTGMITITNDAPVLFCVGDTTVTWTATDACGNVDTCTQNVSIGGGICATKYYDENANGMQDPGEPGIPGWLITVTGGASLSGVTDATGTICFPVGAGKYTVTEGTPNEPNWVHTTPVSVEVVIGPGSGSATVSFGNYCFDAPSGGHTLGFWRNNNGKAILQANDPAWRNVLNALNLRKADGTDFVVPGGSFDTAFNAWKTYNQGANAVNMAYMLSAQLAATTLSVNFFTLDDTAKIVVPGGMNVGGVCIVSFLSVSQPITCGDPPLLALTAIPGDNSCGCTSNAGLVSISDLRARADCLLGAYPLTVASGTERTYEGAVKDLLDIINNNGAGGGACGGITQFIHPASDGFCPFTFGAPK